MKLIIVESPTKAKTISRFIDKGYTVESSFGHIRDLPEKKLGVDVDKDFKPDYVIPAKAKKTVTKLKELAADSDEVILASDEDREGEAIAWHLTEALDLDAQKTKRIVFHEITKPAILEALEHPRTLDTALVDAQQARRVLDRLVGYKLSPFLWKKVAKGLSAGRVQSVAVRLIVEREREIKNFKSDEYWSITANLGTAKKENFDARLHKIDNRSIDKLEIKNTEEAEKIAGSLADATYRVASIEKKEAKKNAPSPFTTSTLQQAANRMLGFSAKQTMMIAQQLYEGIELKGQGQTGLITYMRTDSHNLSQKFLDEAREYLTDKLGSEYALKEARKFKTKSKNAQEAHEAIRPTEATLDPESIKTSLAPNQYKLYKLIWQRAIASQMPEAIVDATTIDIDAIGTPYQFRATGQVLKFDGYLKIYPEKSAELELPEVKDGEELALNELRKEQHFTKPPARYSDAGLVKELEKYGIGRPSTYAPTIATIEARNYIFRDENKKLAPNDIAFVVIDLLVNHFPEIVDYKFTAGMEEQLDEISTGDKAWQPVIREFYLPFIDNLQKKTKEVNKSDVLPEEKSEEVCDKCGAPMIIKTGRYGKYLACSAFPDCKNIKSLKKPGENTKEADEKLKELQEKYKDEVCPKCGSPMAVKNGRFGVFLACTKYPKCKSIKNMAENTATSTGVTCPTCGQGELIAKRSRRGVFYACNRYPDCKTAFNAKPLKEKCPDCGSILVETKDGSAKCSSKECEYTK